MKQKKYTEFEIFEKLDEWNKSHKHIHNTNLVSQEVLLELKQMFMTPQGFRKAIEKAGLVETQFDYSEDKPKD